MKNRLLLISVASIFIIIFIIFYKGLQNPNIYTPNTNIEKNIPIFETKIFDSEDTVNSKNFFLDNKFYLLNIWASWCVPCRNEHSFLISLSKKRDIEIIGLNYKDNIKNAKNFIRELGNPYSVIFLDLDGTISIEWGAYGVPETFLIYDKKIIKKIIGPINDDSFVEIEKMIK